MSLIAHLVFILCVTISALRVNGYTRKVTRQCKIKLNSLPDISTIDQFIQAALNTATSTPQLVTNSSPQQITEALSIDSEKVSSLNPLGKDLLIFLFTTIGVVPLFKYLKASPVIGFLSAGLLMGPAGLHLFSDLNDMESLADFGVLFLLFEQGLELTVERLKSLSKFAFGMGSLQVLLSTLAFFIFPFIGGVQFLEIVFGSQARYRWWQ